jgi:putative pyruvate formate lyase activating enzyme
VSSLLKWLESCRVCPNACGVDRLRGEEGSCRSGAQIAVASGHLHFGEEPVLVGRGGSGTIFFSACNLACVYCQNYEISQLSSGRAVSAGQLGRLALSLQEAGAENINLVSPTHQAPQIFTALAAIRPGLKLPVVYNCGGYENPRFLRELDGQVDIYMPDFKYGASREGELYSGVKDYPRHCRAALREMHRQVGDLEMDDRGVARRGLLVRHLVLPGGLASSRPVIDFLAGEVSPHTWINIMDQYHPAWKAGEHRELRRRVCRCEVDEVVEYARSRGMTRVYG